MLATCILCISSICILLYALLARVAMHSMHIHTSYYYTSSYEILHYLCIYRTRSFKRALDQDHPSAGGIPSGHTLASSARSGRSVHSRPR